MPALILYSGGVFASLCPCHDYSLEMFTRYKDWLFTLFLRLLPFWRGNRRLVVNSSTGAHLSLASGNSKRRLADCKYPTWSLSISYLRIRGSRTWEQDWGTCTTCCCLLVLLCHWGSVSARQVEVWARDLGQLDGKKCESKEILPDKMLSYSSPIYL